jgi:hypothetical protein
LFPKDGEAKVIKPSQKIGEIIAAGKAKVLPSGSTRLGMTSWLRKLWPRRRQAQFILMDVEEDSAIDELKKYEVWITGDVFIQNRQLMFRTEKPVQGNTTGSVVLLGSTKEQANFLLPAYSKAADKHMKLRLYGLLISNPNAKDPTLPSVSFITWKVHLPTDPDDLPNNQKIIIGPEDKIPGYEVEVKEQKR